MAKEKKPTKVEHKKRKGPGGKAKHDKPSRHAKNQEQDAEDIRRAVDDGMQDLRIKKT